MTVDSYLDLIGNTPIIKLRDPSASIYVKLEGVNPGGSHKARIALNMILEAESQGVLKRGSLQTLIEPTGGNTGIGLAIAAAILGYRVKLIIPDNYSAEKQKILRVLGADVMLSDSTKGLDSHVKLLWDTLLKHPDHVFLDQFNNPANASALKLYAGAEIIAQMDRVDYFVCGIGTGGSITGIGEALKERFTEVKIIGVQPEGCDVLNGRFVPHRIQGIALGMTPPFLNRDLIDGMISVSVEDAVKTVKDVIGSDGMFLGISSGAYIHAARKLAEDVGSDKIILTMSPDFGSSYLEYFD